jgi:hypothetical protein
MDAFTRDDLHALLADRPGPCVSLYAPTHPGGSEQDPVRWKNLLAEAEARLAAAGFRGAKGLLAPADRLLGDGPFWAASRDGLACFLAPGFDRVYRLAMPWAERAVVGGRFYVKPLLPWVEGGDFYVLVLSRNEARLVRGTPHGAERVELPGGPLSLEKALAAHDTDEPLTLHTAGRGAGRWEAVFHGHGVGIDDAKDDLLRYFRAVDRAVHPVLRRMGRPLVVAGVEYLLPIFREACSYRDLLDDGIAGSPDRLSDRELADRARPLVEPLLWEGRASALAAYRRLAGTGRTSHDTAEVVSAGCRGAVEVLFVSPGCDVWGRYDPAADLAEVHDREHPGDEELTNLAAVGALRHGRAVHSLELCDMPEGSAVAAVFPLPLAKHGKRP